LNTIVSYLMPAKWRSLAFEVRATSGWVVDISSALVSAAAQRVANVATPASSQGSLAVRMLLGLMQFTTPSGTAFCYARAASSNGSPT